MTLFEQQAKEVFQQIDYDNISQATKRIIDFTLDSESVELYRKVLNFLDLQDREINKISLKDSMRDLLGEVLQVLELKQQKDYQNPNTLLTVENLIRSYPKSGFALGPISFSIKERQIIGLVGENGNGKTTLLRSLCGELRPTSGHIKYHFDYKDDYDLRSHLIYIPQRTDSWQGSLLSNLKFTASTYGINGENNELVTQLVIARMGLRQFRNHSWKDLSSGYKMRFELARALLRKPKLLLIDEPLANLDILAQQIVLDDFKDISNSAFRPIGIVLSSQQLYEVEKTSNSVIFLKNGSPRNIAEDTDVTYTEVPKFIIEFETRNTQEEVRTAFAPLSLERLDINGGTYVATFPDSVTTDDFLLLVLERKIPIAYFRNISKSTRRFFLS